MGRGGHLPKLRPLQDFAVELDRELQQRLIIQDDAISRYRVSNTNMYESFQGLLAKCQRVSSNASYVRAANHEVSIKNARLRIKNEALKAKLNDIATQCLHVRIHLLNTLKKLRCPKAPRKFLSPTVKKKRLLFLGTRQGKWLKKLKKLGKV